MKVLTINSGSSSLKVALFDMKSEKRLSFLEVEKIGERVSRMIFQKETVFEGEVKSHFEAIEIVEDFLSKRDILKNFNHLFAVGHRVVHGGEKFKKSVLIDKNVMREIERLSSLAPLHNPANLKGIEAVLKKSSKVPQVAVFDTSFHQTLPKEAFLYAIDYNLYEKEGIRRYGFHGTSHSYVAKEAAKILGRSLKELNLITLHLGNGASAAAIKRGKSIETSMGFTPLEGLVMGSRSGDIDAGAILYLLKKGFDFESLDYLLNKNSGLKGLCGVNDMREIEKRLDKERFREAFDVFCHRIKKYIGAYMAVLGGADVLVFTAGIGENSALVREKVCSGLDVFGIKIDKEKNRNGQIDISKEDSKVKILVIKTDEEIEIARESVRVVSKIC